jgi:ketosteroid isomerase-like protein
MPAQISLEERLLAVEDRLAIYELVASYGYAIDASDKAMVAGLFSENAIYAVGDFGEFQGPEAIAAIADSAGHQALLAVGCGHISTLPHVVISGDYAVATCHTMVVKNDGSDGYLVARLSASRIEFSRKSGGGWQIDHRQNHLQRGDGYGASLLGRMKEGPKP